MYCIFVRHTTMSVACCDGSRMRNVRVTNVTRYFYLKECLDSLSSEMNVLQRVTRTLRMCEN